MDQRDREQAFMTALTTEHFVLQTYASSTISEAGSRSSIYLLSVSTSLIALGFSTGDPRVFGPMASAVVPTLFLLGWFTVVRLTDTSVENLRCLRKIARIRQHYASLTAEAEQFFPTTIPQATDARSLLGIRYRRTRLLFTMATMIGTVNAVLGGSGLALLLEMGFGASRTVAVAVGAALAVILLGAALAYQRRRFTWSLRTPDD